MKKNNTVKIAFFKIESFLSGLMKTFPSFIFLPLLISTIVSCKEQSNCFKVATESMMPNLELNSEVCFSEKDTIEKGDIVLFDFDNAFKDWMFRVIATNGDSLTIKNGYIILNRDTLKEEYDIIDKFRLSLNDTLRVNLKDVKLSKIGDQSFEFIGSRNELVELMEKHDIQGEISSSNKIAAGIVRKPDSTEIINASNISPLYVPRVNETIQSDTNNYELYKLALDSMQIDSIRRTRKTINFTVSEPLYFLMGDNRVNSMDSRFIGLVPLSKIKGVYYESQ